MLSELTLGIQLGVMAAVIITTLFLGYGLSFLVKQPKKTPDQYLYTATVGGHKYTWKSDKNPKHNGQWINFYDEKNGEIVNLNSQFVTKITSKKIEGDSNGK